MAEPRPRKLRVARFGKAGACVSSLASLALVFVVMLLVGCASQPYGDSSGGPSISASSAGDASPRRRASRQQQGEARAQESRQRRQNSDILLELGRRYYERGEYELALERLNSALTVDPRSASAHSMLAILYETINSPERAGEHYRRSVQYAPETGDVLNNYGNWLCRQGRFDEAQAHFRRALADPFYRTPDDAAANAGNCALAAGDVAGAEAYFAGVLQSQPTYMPALLGMADVAFHKQEYMRARAFMQRAEALGPLGENALRTAVRIEEQLGDSRSAAAYRAQLQQ
ncbi:MAG: type IV pilus biogenesis/stability protein PilW [Xanthomonadales bacterium]|nr:type IV pilus biogenesis/stability protein PilW [Xanthomonadales bacterium]